MNFDNLPKGWKSVELDEVVYIRKGTINPQDYPEEIFELYSISAYQATGGAEIKQGRDIAKPHAGDCPPGKSTLQRSNSTHFSYPQSTCGRPYPQRYYYLKRQESACPTLI